MGVFAGEGLKLTGGCSLYLGKVQAEKTLNVFFDLAPGIFDFVHEGGFFVLLASSDDFRSHFCHTINIEHSVFYLATFVNGFTQADSDRLEAFIDGQKILASPLRQWLLGVCLSQCRHRQQACCANHQNVLLHMNISLLSMRQLRWFCRQRP
ncbi:hypothetical protein [Pseudomonas helleri]|uniref:hypothetical protein n=1 Tax=Pseudomonas helleri TaxID=1608996 RepID=UPI003F9A8728